MKPIINNRVPHCFIARAGKGLLMIVLFILLRPALLEGQGQTQTPPYSGFEQHTLIGNYQPDKLTTRKTCVAPWGLTQEQIILDGTVSDQKGVIIPNTTLSFINNVTGKQEIVASDATGHFLLEMQLPGEIQPEPSHSIIISGSWSQCSSIFDGNLYNIFQPYDGRGDVPLGEKDRGDPSKATVPGNSLNGSSALDIFKFPKTLPEDTFSVVRQEFRTTIELLNWLNDQSSKRLKLVAMVSASDYKSFFIFAKSTATGALPYCHIFEISAPNNEADLKAALLAHAADTFVGMHKISTNSVALVFRNGN